jgi:hypothetical protein
MTEKTLPIVPSASSGGKCSLRGIDTSVILWQKGKNDVIAVEDQTVGARHSRLRGIRHAADRGVA